MGNTFADITEDGNVWDDTRLQQELPQMGALEELFSPGGSLEDFVNVDSSEPSCEQGPQLIVAPVASERWRGFNWKSSLRRETRLDKRKSLERNPSKISEDKELSWTVLVDRSRGERLGISLRVTRAGRLEVTAVDPSGLVAAWNGKAPSRALRPGDRILEVNGESGKEHVYQKLGSHEFLSIAVARDEDVDESEFDMGVQNPSKVVLHAGAGDTQTIRSQGAADSLNSTSSPTKKRGWAPLDECVALRDNVLLTNHRLLELHPFLPLTVRFASCWKLIYCPRIHGTSLRTFYRQCQAWPGETLFFIEDTNGAIFGGFASTPWKVAREKAHFGQPDCFVFSYGFSAENRMLSVYPWAGGNDFFMFADWDGFSMGGGDKYAIWIDKDFLRGTSASSATFGNQGPLGSSEEFCVRHFECWTFDSFSFGSSAAQAILDDHRRGNLETVEDFIASTERETDYDASQELLRGEEGCERRRGLRDLQLREYASEALRFEAIT